MQREHTPSRGCLTPIAGRYTAMNPIQGKMQAPWNDYLSSIGRPTGMRGSQLTYTEYCGTHNTDVTHTRPGGTSAIATVHLLETQVWMGKIFSAPADPYINRSVSRSAFCCTFNFLQQSSFRLFIARSLLSPVPVNPTQALK